MDVHDKAKRTAGPATHHTTAADPALKLLLAEMEALAHIMPRADQDTSDVDHAEDAFDNMPV